MKIVLVNLLLVIGSYQLFCQVSFTDSQTKYWYYRDRLKYFVMPGSEAGQSVVLTCRNSYKDFGNNYPIYSGIETANTHKLQGYYIGMLATEYKLLKDNGQISSASETLIELNLALDALNRMDYCEGDVPWNGVWTSPSYNGFFIRDDFPPILSQQMTEYLNEGLADGTFHDYEAQIANRPGFPFSINSNCVSARKKYENPANYYYQYPHIWKDENDIEHIFDVAAYSAHNETYWSYWKDECFTSNDEIIGDLMGLALVTNCVDDFAIRLKAINIAYRYFSIMNSPVYQMRFPDFSPILSDDGGYTGGFLWGVASVVNRMLPLIDMSDLGGFGLSPFIQYQTAVLFYITTNTNENFYNRGLYSKLIALSEASPNPPYKAINKIGNQAKIETFYLLLWAVSNNKDLREEKYKYPFSNLINDLNNAPCGGPFCLQHYYGIGGHNVSPGWDTEYKYDSDLSSQIYNTVGHNGVYPGLDYMLLYNLACLAFPDGFESDGQTYRFPYYVNMNNRHDVFTHYPYTYVYSSQGAHMNVFGSVSHPEEIRAISTIESHMVVATTTEIIFTQPQYENENLNFDENGDVTLKAGESITLTDGFRVDAGAHFLARIESYSCGGVSYKNMAAPPWDENYRGCFYDTLISVPMEKRAPIVYSEDNYEEADFDMPLWNDYYYMNDTTAATELAVGAWLNPNPCGSSATLMVVSENEQQLTIELYDMTGIKRETVFNDIADQNLELDLNLSSYASGTYMLRITGSGGVKVLRFVKE